MGPATIVAHSGMLAIALTEPLDMAGKLSSYGIAGADEPQNVDSMQLAYRGLTSYVSIEVSLTTSRSVIAGVSPTDLRRLGLEPESMPLAALNWRQSARTVLLDGAAIPGTEAERGGGWEFRGLLENIAEEVQAELRLQIIAIGFDRDPVLLRRAHPAEFIPNYWRR